MTTVARRPITLDLFRQGRHTIKIPGNGIAQPGIDAIKGHLTGEGLPNLPWDWCWDWRVTGKGEYVGALPKRIGKFYYQEHATKLTPDQLTTIGNLGAQHCPKTEMYEFDFVDRIDWEAGDFGDDDSCYWLCHTSAKEMITDNGGGAVRFFDPGTTEGIARAWIVPRENGCILVFNGYGLETLPITRILATHFGHAYYRQVSLRNNNEYKGALWINGGKGYLIGPQEVVTSIDAIDLGWDSPDDCVCEHCGECIDEDDHYYSPNDNDYCETCYGDRVFYCDACSEDCWLDDARTDPSEDLICESCYAHSVRYCEHCENDIWESDAKEGPDGNTICDSCYDNKVVECAYCTAEIWSNDAKEDPEGEECCRSCFNDRFVLCDDCGEVNHAETSLCDDCQVEEKVTI